MSIRLVSASVWLPERQEHVADISRESDLSEEVARKKLGIVRKFCADPDIHPTEMAVFAAQRVLRNIDPKSIDLLIWTGPEYKDYPIWSAGVHVQDKLGLTRAWAFNIGAQRSNSVVGLKVAKTLMMTDSRLNRALLCGGQRNNDLVNYSDPAVRGLFSLGDAGSAMLLERGNTNVIGESAVITGGSFSEELMIPGGGTRKRFRDGLDVADVQFPDNAKTIRRLLRISTDRFADVIREAARKSLLSPINFLALAHLSRPIHDRLLKKLGLRPSQSIYLEHFGHLGAPDQALSIGLAEKRGLLKPGDHVVLAGADVGHTWSAISLRWNQAIFSGDVKYGDYGD